MQKYLRAKEVAKIYHIGLSTVWKYAKDGKLHPKRMSPRVTLFLVDDVELLLNS